MKSAILGAVLWVWLTTWAMADEQFNISTHWYNCSVDIGWGNTRDAVTRVLSEINLNNESRTMSPYMITWNAWDDIRRILNLDKNWGFAAGCKKAQD
jgi:hypothetical protein